MSGMARIPGGASRETWKAQAARADGVSRGIIIRIDPETSLIDTDRRTEYAAIEAAYKAGLQVPEPLFLEQDLKWIGRPFSVTSEITDCMASAEAFPPQHLDKIAEQKWTFLGKLAQLDPATMGLDDVMEMPDVSSCALEQLDYWHKVIIDDELHPNPIAHAAIRWLKRNPPPAAQKLSLVHGDFRSGNFLYSPDGDITAVLDWEMAHIGDPLEDLAWSLDPLWSWSAPELAGKLVPHAEAIRIWEAASGMKVDPVAFHWWRVFASVKGIGIWISSSEDFHNGVSKESILAMAGWLMTDRQQQIIVDFLSPHSPHRFPEAVK
tara:strand:- start:44627 stop:45592 length:966 start_codon:yes stop_codon:yes gene_type:complete